MNTKEYMCKRYICIQMFLSSLCLCVCVCVYIYSRGNDKRRGKKFMVNIPQTFNTPSSVSPAQVHLYALASFS